MDNFIYSNPTKLLFGKGMISKIGAELQSAGIQKVLMLAGGGSIKSNGVYTEFVESMQMNSIEFVEFWGVQANPILSHAEQAIQIIKENNLQAIVAVGGGSVIDEAKAISVGTFANKLWDLYEYKEKVQNALPIFVILTISATGSEMNGGSVLTNMDEQKKWALWSPLLYPKVSIVDPSKQMSLPWHQTANGAIDAMSHIMENYFVASNQEVTISYDESLMRSIILHTNNLQKSQDDYDSRANLAWIATMALNGYSGIGIKSGDWSTHKIEHGVSALHPEVAHGAGLSVLFPAWIKYMHKYNEPTFIRWAKNVWNADSVVQAVQNMKAQYKAWGAPTTLRELNIEHDELESIADNIMLQSGFGVLKQITREDIIEILEIAY